ncbi:MAG: hypothetical protein Q9164_000410 [Protoblastenia rupestris]
MVTRDKRKWDEELMNGIVDMIIKYRHLNCMSPVIHSITLLLKCIALDSDADVSLFAILDDERIFHAIFDDPGLDPRAVTEQLVLAAKHSISSLRLRDKTQHVLASDLRANLHGSDGFFPFMDLPSELRDKIYGKMMATEHCLKTTSRQRPYWFNTAMLCVSRQVHREASYIFFKNPITIVINPLAMACSHILDIELPRESTLKKLQIELDFSDGRLLAREVYGKDAKPWAALEELVHRVSGWLEWWSFLEELHISCRRPSTSLQTGNLIGNLESRTVKIFPDEILDCFRTIKGLRKLTFSGDLPTTYTDPAFESISRPVVERRRESSGIGE